MLDEKEIDCEISRLEYIESSYSNYSKLADLYIIKNQMQGVNEVNTSQDYEYVQERSGNDLIELYGDSEFMRAVCGKKYTDILEIVDELMDTLRVVNEKAYRRVLLKIGDL